MNPLSLVDKSLRTTEAEQNMNEQQNTNEEKKTEVTSNSQAEPKPQEPNIFTRMYNVVFPPRTAGGARKKSRGKKRGKKSKKSKTKKA